MKLIVFFIAFLVLSLSSLPCCLPQEIGENVGCMESHANTENDHSGDETCSPFFNCGSCTGFPIQEKLEISFVKDELSIVGSIFYEDISQSAYQNPDFKPPKSLII